MSGKDHQTGPKSIDSSPDPSWPATYYAVIFSSQMTGVDPEGYSRTAQVMDDLAKTMPGYLGIESARNPEGDGITISYWESEEAIANWKSQARHQTAQKIGKEKWYANYRVRVCKVERDYSS